MTAEHAHVFVHNLSLNILQGESRTTASVLASVPGHHLDYRPDASARSARSAGASRT